MTERTKRATVYLEPEIHRALRLRSAETSLSMSEVVNDAVREALAEDAEDLAAFAARKDERTLPYEEFLKELRRNGTI